jgi:CRISPR type III-B/RAMP module RAMP protein Cmr6
MESRRNNLRLAERNKGLDHPGLALARYIQEVGDKSEAARQMHALMANTAVTLVYVNAYTRWEQIHAVRPDSLRIMRTLASPLALGLGNETVTEIGITTQHTYGVPVIPGSAVKGVCRRGAERLLKEGKIKAEEFRVLFGDTDSASYFIFWDAWYVPGSVGGKPFHQDVITVHHPDYYGKSGKENRWPTDFDDPNPVPFLVVKPGAQFLFAVDAPAEWSKFIQQLLIWSLSNIGVGGKTNAGYGYFQNDRSNTDPTAPPVDTDTVTQPPVQPAGEEWAGVLLTYNPGNQELIVSHEGRKAVVTGEKCQQIRASLGDRAEELKKKKSLNNVTVRVEPIGNGWRIVSVMVP